MASLDSPRDAVFVGLAHPADRAVFHFFARLLAAADPPVGSRLITDGGDPFAQAGDERFQIRSEALDAVRLAVTGHVPGSASKRRDYAEASCRGAARPGLTTLSIERVLCYPLAALQELGRSLGLAFTPEHLEAARGGLEELQKSVGSYLHPLCYLDAYGSTLAPAPAPPEPRQDLPIDVTFLNDLDPGAPVLLLGKVREQELADLGAQLDRLDVIEIALPPGGPVGTEDVVTTASFAGDPEQWPDVAPFQPRLVYLHDMSDHPDLAAVLAWTLDQLPLSGRLAGREPTAAAMHQLLAGLTRGGGGEKIDFILDGPCWAAVPPAYWGL